jgi:hypothetical protein
MSASLERLLKSLANHSDLIASAYSYGHISKDGKNERALNQLHQQKILVKRDEENYRLTAQLSQFLDYALSSERIRRLDTDLGSWMDTLEQSIGLYQTAHHEQRMDDCDNYKFEIEHLVFQLADTLEENTHYLLILVQLAQLQIQLDARFSHPLVVYRGDKDYRADTCLQLLQQLKRPVLAMTDLDPAGLAIAQALPYVVALVAPKLSVVETFFLSQKMANPNLYTQQLAQYRAVLDGSEYATIRAFWQLLNRYQAGIVQEHWLNVEIELLINDLIDVTQTCRGTDSCSELKNL